MEPQKLHCLGNHSKCFSCPKLRNSDLDVMSISSPEPGMAKSVRKPEERPAGQSCWQQAQPLLVVRDGVLKAMRVTKQAVDRHSTREKKSHTSCPLIESLMKVTILIWVPSPEQCADWQWGMCQLSQAWLSGFCFTKALSLVLGTCPWQWK